MGVSAPLLGFVQPVAAIVGLVGWGGLAWWYVRRRYEVLGWAIDDQHLLVRNGVVYGRLHIVRLDKIQSLGMRATFFQRRLDLASLRVSTAGAGLAGPNRDQRDALDPAENGRRPWASWLR